MPVVPLVNKGRLFSVLGCGWCLPCLTVHPSFGSLWQCKQWGERRWRARAGGHNHSRAHTGRGGVGHLGLTHTGTQRGRLWTTGGRRRGVGSKNRQTTPATTSTTSVRHLPGTANAQTASAAISTAPAHQPLGSANAETTPTGAPAAAAVRTQRRDATCEGKNG